MSKLKKITDLPKEIGKYSVIVDGVEFFDDYYLEFDGEKWIDLDNLTSFTDGNLSQIFYLNESPALTNKVDNNSWMSLKKI